MYCRETWLKKTMCHEIQCTVCHVPRIYGCPSSSLISGAVTEEVQLSPLPTVFPNGGRTEEKRVLQWDALKRHRHSRGKRFVWNAPLKRSLKNTFAPDAPQRIFCKTRHFLSRHTDARWKCMASDASQKLSLKICRSDAPRNTLLGKDPNPEI